MKKRDLPAGVYFDVKTGKYIAKIKVGGVMSKSKMFDTPEDAAREVALLRHSARKHANEIVPRGLALGKWLDEWIVKRRNAGQWRDVDGDEKLLARYVGADMRARILRELRQRDIRAWLYELSHRQAKDGGGNLKGRTLSRRTIANALNLLRVALEDAVSAGKMSSNPALGLRPPKRGGATTVEHTGYLTVEAIGRLFAQDIPLVHRTFFILSLYAGLRVGEVCGLRWENVILGGARPEIVVRFSRNGPTKGGKVRRTPLLAQAREALIAWRAAHKVAPLTGLLFPSRIHRGGDPQPHARGFNADWPVWARKAGIEMPLKQLRHSCGCHLVQGSWGPPATMEQVQNWLGHESITTTEKFYARFKPGALHSLRESIDGSVSGSVGKKKPKGKNKKSPSE
jgi:integrase